MYPFAGYSYPWHHPMQGAWSPPWGYVWQTHVYARYARGYRPFRTDRLQDHGQQPYVVNIDQAAKQNQNYRTALWTGKHFQVTLMSINVGDDIGLEVHPTTDQFIRIEEGQGWVQMGSSRDHLDYQVMAYDGYAIMVPAGTWHNVTNAGEQPLKVYVIYAPPAHPYGTVEETKAIAQEHG